MNVNGNENMKKRYSVKAIQNGCEAIVSELREVPTGLGLQEVEHVWSKEHLKKQGVTLHGDHQNKFRQVRELLERTPV